jgi:hypothetical protein
MRKTFTTSAAVNADEFGSRAKTIQDKSAATDDKATASSSADAEVDDVAAAIARLAVADKTADEAAADKSNSRQTPTDTKE